MPPALLAILKGVLLNPSFEAGAIQLFEEIGGLLIKSAHLPAEIEAIGQAVIAEAGTLIGAVAVGTPVEAHVSPANVAAATAATGSGTQTAQS